MSQVESAFNADPILDILEPHPIKKKIEYAATQNHRVKRLFHDDLATEYCFKETGACYLFEAGQELIAKYPMKEPEH